VLRKPSPENHYFCCGNVIDEQGHGCARADGLVSDLVRTIKPEGGLPTEGGACRSQNLEDTRVGDEARFPLVGYGVDGGGASSAGECAKNLLCLVSVSEDWAECSVSSSALCSGVHFLTVFFIHKCDSDMLSFGE
jgi:hypothetical protein